MLESLKKASFMETATSSFEQGTVRHNDTSSRGNLFTGGLGVEI